jgi:PKD repeat protein
MLKVFGLTCFVVLNLRVAAQSVPVVTFSNTAFCSGSVYSFSLTASITPQSYSWTVIPSETVIVNNSRNNPVLQCNFSNAGSYTIRLAFTAAGATFTASRVVSVFPKPVAAFSASLTTQGYPTDLVATNFSTSQTKNYWIDDNDFSVRDSLFNHSKYITASGQHSVKLISIGKGGCSDTSSYTYYVNDSSGIILPNVFTPNEDDVNDVYRPILHGISTLHAWVYNKDGVQVAEWMKVNGSWDGRTTSGEVCSQGQYLIIVEADGFNAAKYKLKRMITLLR